MISAYSQLSCSKLHHVCTDVYMHSIPFLQSLGQESSHCKGLEPIKRHDGWLISFKTGHVVAHSYLQMTRSMGLVLQIFRYSKGV